MFIIKNNIFFVDYSSNKMCLFIGDIGGNVKPTYKHTIYKIEEPYVNYNDYYSKHTRTWSKFYLKYPDGKHDAEAMLIDAKSREIILITKSWGHPATVFKETLGM